MKFINFKNKKFNKQIEDIGKDIHEKVSVFVHENKGFDEQLYSYAMLKLSDGRIMSFSFPDMWCSDSAICIDEEELDKDTHRYSGNKFTIMPSKKKNKYLVSISLCNSDEKRIHYVVGNEYFHNVVLTEEEKENILLYMKQIYEQLPTLEYDKELTHSVDNYTCEVKTRLKIQRFNEEIKKLRETNPESSVLPSVETAVNWWIKQITGVKLGGWCGDEFTSIMNMAMANEAFSSSSVNATQIIAFRESLSKAIMNDLSKGEYSSLDVDYGPGGTLLNAAIESNLKGVLFPMKTHMIVDIDSVRVVAGYGMPEEEIFAVDDKNKVLTK